MKKRKQARCGAAYRDKQLLIVLDLNAQLVALEDRQ